MSLFRRISLDEVMTASYDIWINSETANQIARDTVQIINKTYARKFSFFTGKSSKSLLGGLFYLLGYRHNAIKKQREIAVKLGTTEVSIRASYRQWLETFPDLFLDIISKFAQDKDLRTYILLTLKDPATLNLTL